MIARSHLSKHIADKLNFYEIMVGDRTVTFNTSQRSLLRLCQRVI
ncbi:hypothetical protein [Gloeocapsopsis dulcis]|nr:hypothetical protein [Gloeocapsopsis dulcis]WNN91113.1 hypothetical protein P0S91_08565 [Gloeocapsopsis dulcis]